MDAFASFCFTVAATIRSTSESTAWQQYEMSVRESGEPRVRVRGATRFARQTPCRLHVPVFQRPPRCKRDFAGVIQCYILVRTSLAPLPSMSPPAPAPPSRRIHLLKGAGALEQMRKHASDVYRAVVKYLSFFCGRLLSRGQPRCNYTISVTSLKSMLSLRCAVLTKAWAVYHQALSRAI